MILLDVNVLVYAFREDSEDHCAYNQYLQSVIGGDAAFSVSELVLSGFLRIVTHPAIYRTPTPLDAALAYTQSIRSAAQFVPLAPGVRHWGIFSDLCRKVRARGNLIPDAYHAALAIESGSQWISADRGFARFPNLDWHHPLD